MRLSLNVWFKFCFIEIFQYITKKISISSIESLSNLVRFFRGYNRIFALLSVFNELTFWSFSLHSERRLRWKSVELRLYRDEFNIRLLLLVLRSGSMFFFFFGSTYESLPLNNGEYQNFLRDELSWGYVRSFCHSCFFSLKPLKSPIE